MSNETLTSTPSDDVRPQLAAREQWQDDVAARNGIGDGPNGNLLEPQRHYQKGDGLKAYVRQMRMGLGEQHRQFQELWPEFKTGFAKGVEQGIQEGYIPPYVVDRLQPALEKTGVGLADPRVIDPDDRGHTAAYTPAGDVFRLKPTDDSRRHVLDSAHELFHKLSGGTFQRDAEDPAHILRTRGGYNNLRDAEKRAPTHVNLDEAIIHHLAIGTITGDFATLDPDKRADGNDDQYVRRKIVATFVERARGVIDVKTLTNAVFEDSGPEGASEFRRKLVRETVNAYGFGALRKLEHLCNAALALDDNTVSQEILDRITPLELDESGAIINHGKINLENPDTPVLTAAS